MRKPNIPAQAVRNFCLSLGLFPNWKNMRLCWDLLCLAWMPLESFSGWFQLGLQWIWSCANRGFVSNFYHLK